MSTAWKAAVIGEWGKDPPCPRASLKNIIIKKQKNQSISLPIYNNNARVRGTEKERALFKLDNLQLKKKPTAFASASKKA